jgi:hypothetical protein
MACQSMTGMVWPDGKALIDQPVRLREAFQLIGAVQAKCKKRGEA